MIDMAAGARSIARESTNVGTSTTEDTSCYAFKFLNNYNDKIQNKWWRVIDTPGMADTSGIGVDVNNSRQMTRFVKALGPIGNIDAIVFVWQATTKLTDEVLGCIATARQAVGPGFWKKLIIMYTFVTWGTLHPAGMFGPAWYSCDVVPDTFASTDVSNVLHRQVVTRMKDYMLNVVRVPEQECMYAARGTPCIPDDANDFPWVGSGATMEKVKAMVPGWVQDPDAGFAVAASQYLNPYSTYYTSSPNCTQQS